MCSCAVLSGYGVCDSFRVSRALLVEKSASSDEERYCQSYRSSSSKQYRSVQVQFPQTGSCSLQILPVTELFPLCSVLPEDEWFADVAQIAIKMMLGQANFDTTERDITNSPTASVSARSVSSIHSHGSQ